MFKKLSKKKGFTLIEMMIVVAIIASLIAIIIPPLLVYWPALTPLLMRRTCVPTMPNRRLIRF